jgi:hypothetical protein
MATHFLIMKESLVSDILIRGKSENASFEEAIKDAILKINEFASANYPDAEISSHLSGLTYSTGGFAGQKYILEVEFAINTTNQHFSIPLQPRGPSTPQLPGGNGNATGRPGR